MIVYFLIIVGFLMRLVPHVPNMAPIAAIAIFSGAYLNKKIVPWVPLAIMIASDLIIGMHDVVLYTWGAFIVIGFFGMRLRENRSPVRIFKITITSALFFFAVSNLGVWIAWYPNTWAGLTQCYVNAIPFLRNTMVSNVLFSFAFFGIYEYAKKAFRNYKYKTVLLT